MLKSKIEAVLFLTDKPMKAQAIARIVNEEANLVRQAILELINDYEERPGGLEIADDDGYILQVKDEYASLTNEFVPLDMPVALLRTLSAIAIKQPVPQSDVIKIRGAGAYDHIKELITRELIVKKEDGRSPLLSTTKKFQEYFRLSGDGKGLRKELKKQDQPEVPGTEDGAQLVLDLPLELLATDQPAAAPTPVSLDPVASILGTTEINASPADELRFDPAGAVNTLNKVFDASPDSSLVFNADPKADQNADPADLESTESTVVPGTPDTAPATD